LREWRPPRPESPAPPPEGIQLGLWGLGKELKLTDCQFENAKIKVQNAKLRNPDVVGMDVLVVVLLADNHRPDRDTYRFRAANHSA
jgi:hypothetical protein